MSSTEQQNLVGRLREFAETFVEIEEKDDARSAYDEFFTVDMVERLAEQWTDHAVEIETIIGRVGGIRGFSIRVKSLIATIKRTNKAMRRQAQVDVIEQINQQGVMSSSLPDYLTDDMPNYLIPSGYDLNLAGVFEVRPSADGDDIAREKVCSSPIIMTRRGRDSETGHMQVEVAWVEPPGPGRGKPAWRHRTVERSVLFDSQKIKGLIDFGAPVNSVNLNNVIKWLDAFEDINQHLIPLTNGSKRLGWQHDGSFLLPDGHYKKDNQQELKLFPMEGMEPIMRSLHSAGTWEGWLQVVESIRDHPLAMLAIYASAAAPLLHILRCPNFAVDWSNQTSTGKTTSLRIGASVWGYPVDDDERGFIYSWDATKVWTERAAGFLHSLPLILDETKRVKDKQHVANVLFDFCSGKGRGRGTLQGVDATHAWKTTLLSTGEQRLSSFTNDGGVRARVLALVGSPIQGPPATARPLAESVRGRLYNHYGHLGRKIITYLVHHNDQWDYFRERYESRRSAYGAITTTAVGGRLAAYVAALDMAQAVCETLGVPPPTNDPIQYLVQAIREGADDADIARDAFIAAVSWAASNRTRFNGSKAAQRAGYPNYGWAGRWQDQDDWEYLAIDKHVLSEVLDKYSYDFAEVVPQWGARGWINKTTKGLTRTINIDGIQHACVCPMRNIYEEMMAENLPEIEPPTVLEVQADMLDSSVTRADATWSSRAFDL